MFFNSPGENSLVLTLVSFLDHAAPGVITSRRGVIASNTAYTPLSSLQKFKTYSGNGCKGPPSVANEPKSVKLMGDDTW